MENFFKWIKSIFTPLIRVPEGSMEKQCGLPLIRQNGWDYYDSEEIKKNIKKGDDKK